MGARGFILMLLLFALVGAGAGYGAAQIAPADEQEQTPATANLVAPGTGGEATGFAGNAAAGRAGQTGAQNVTVDDVLATMPQEMRQQMESDPELAAQMRAQLQAAIDSGQVPAEAFGLGTQGAGTFDPSGQDPNVRNAEPLAGTVAAFESGTLRLDTPDGEASVVVPPETPVQLTTNAASAQPHLASGSEASVIARPNGTGETGGLTAATIVIGASDQGAVGGRGFGAAAATTGSIVSFADGVLTLETAEGSTGFAVADETPVRITMTVAEASGELTVGASVVAFVQREADGSLAAVSVSVGGGGGGLGRGLFVGGQGGRQRGNTGAEELVPSPQP